MIEIGTMKAYTIKELSPLLHLSPKKVREYCFTGRLKAVKVGRNWYVTEENLQKYLNRDQQTNPPTPQGA